MSWRDFNLNKNYIFLFFVYRSVLDFDFEKLCSISLSHINVYACLICGKYFQGKSLSTIYERCCIKGCTVQYSSV